MGIIRFYKWYKDRFASDIYKIRKGNTFKSIGINIDCLMIDLNGIFHTSAQRVYQYGNFKQSPSLLRKQRTINCLNKQIIVFEDICKEIKALVNMVNPKKELVLCVDGPAPMSKLNQQRKRRYKSVKERSDKDIEEFDSNCITPGTKFMDHMTKYIDWFIRKEISENVDWRQFKTIFSNEKAVGEGEQKCFSYIRTKKDPNITYCVFGNDADLIMLAMGTHLKNIYILREDIFTSVLDYFIINVGKISYDLAEILRWSTDDTIFKTESSIDDFIFLCFMVGNDFLPHVPSIEIIGGGIEIMLDVYKNTCKHYGHITRIIDKDITFDKKSLQMFLGNLSQYEKGMLEEKMNKSGIFFPDDILNRHITLYKDKDIIKYEVKIDMDKYRQDYYETHFPNLSIETLCNKYLEGMQWILTYYMKGVPSWSWCFPYHYAPFAKDIANNVDSFILPEYSKTYPILPYQQLLSVLPPQSSNLLPYPLNKFLEDEMSPLKPFCPDNIVIDYSGKRNEWEGIVVIPMVDFEIIKDIYLKNIHLIDPRDSKRNILGKSFIYQYLDKPFVFKSFYGNIERCYVIVNAIDIY